MHDLPYEGVIKTRRTKGMTKKIPGKYHMLDMKYLPNRHQMICSQRPVTKADCIKKTRQGTKKRKRLTISFATIL